MAQDLHQLTAQIVAFRDARDWAQFHTPDHLAKSISIEAAELLECFLWKQASEADPTKVGEELADILYATLLLAHTLGIDMESALQDKLANNAAKYPIDQGAGEQSEV